MDEIDGFTGLKYGSARMVNLQASPRYMTSVERAGGAAGRIRIVVVDDHPAIREALSDTFEDQSDMLICGEAATASEAMSIIAREKPDVAIVDISLSDAHGLDLVHNIRVQHPNVQVVVFSMYGEDVYAERAIRAGASGYLMKSEPTGKLVQAVRHVARGEVFLSHRMASRIISKVVRKGGQKHGFAVDEFTDREMAVFQMLGQGDSVDDIASRLNLSRKTVETYRRRAKEKLGFETVSELLQFAVQWTHGQVDAG